ncbi:MAG: hypothetical protein L0Y57_01595 [Beijerinckiaceae bacterium]|nr:hypothetical protein [Beijerinckiaceae bacterium]
MDKIDFKKARPEFYRPASDRFPLLEVPAMQFVMIDGEGNPNYRALL